MTGYEVGWTDTAWEAIRVEARVIAVERGATSTAQRWLERIWDAVESLEQWPRRFAKAPEGAFVDYEVRRVVVGRYLLLFTIDDERRRVWVIGLRHGHRLPRPQDLPPAQPGSEDTNRKG